MKQWFDRWVDRIDEKRARAAAESLGSPYHAGIRSVTEAPLPRASRWLLTALVALLIGVLAWATFGWIDVTASAQGTTVVNSRVKPIQAPLRGVVEAIPAAEGERVRRDQPLLRLEDTAVAAKVRDLTGQVARARAARARLEGLLAADQSTDFPSDRAPAQPTLRVEQAVPESILSRARELMASQWRSYLDSVRELQRQRGNRQARLATTRASTESIRAIIPYLEGKVERLETLAGTDSASEQELDDARQRLVQQRQKLQVERQRMQEMKAELALMRQRILAAQSKFREEMTTELAEVEGRLSSARHDLARARNEERQHVIRSPIDGIVQDVSVHARGAVVAPSDTLMRVVPEDQPVEIEASILNRDIGFAHVGQEVDVKFQAYDFTRYGEVPGVIRKIASTSTENEELGRVYRAIVELDERSMTVDGKEVPLRPGLTATVDIDMGSRRIIAYFLEPFLRYRDKALSER